MKLKCRELLCAVSKKQAGALSSEPFQHDLSACGAALDTGMGCAQRGRINLAGHLGNGGTDTPRVNQRRYLIQQVALFFHVGRAEERTRKHQFPVKGDGLAFKRQDVELFGVINQAETALRSDQLNNVVYVPSGLRGGKNKTGSAELQRLDLRGQGLAVVDYMMGPAFTHPCLRFRA